MYTHLDRESSGDLASDAPTDTPHESTSHIDIAATIASCQDFDAKWKEFQRKFDEALAQSLSGLAEALGGGGVRSDVAKLTLEERRAVFDGQTPSLDLIGKGLGAGKYKNVVVCVGAGLSTSAGACTCSVLLSFCQIHKGSAHQLFTAHPPPPLSSNRRHPGLSQPRHRALFQSAEVQPAQPAKHLHSRLLPRESDPFHRPPLPPPPPPLHPAVPVRLPAPFLSNPLSPPAAAAAATTYHARSPRVPVGNGRRLGRGEGGREGGDSKRDCQRDSKRDCQRASTRDCQRASSAAADGSCAGTPRTARPEALTGARARGRGETDGPARGDGQADGDETAAGRPGGGGFPSGRDSGPDLADSSEADGRADGRPVATRGRGG